MGFTNLRKLYPGGISKQWNPYGPGKSPVFCDSVLDFSKADQFANAELTIYLKVWLDPVKSMVGTIRDAAGREFEVLDWTPADDFPGWRRRVADAANKTWDNKLLLIPPKRYDGLDWTGPTGVWQPLVRCRFVFLIGDPSYHHAHVKVVQPKSRPDDAQFGVHSLLWSIDSSSELPKVHNTLGEINRVAACHEVGHLLGLPHIGKITTVKNCRWWTDHNDNACYAAEDPNPLLANNIMGLGMQVTEFNALPWKKEFCKHVNQDETWGKLDPDDLLATTTLSQAPKKR
jgi:hypothetical protein